ncbi:hypothetical protein ACWIDW_14805, partial [Microbacterium sp. NPDC055312]
ITPPRHLESPRFDWMQTTVRDDPEQLWDVLAGTLGGELEDARGLNGYERSKLIKRDGETLARVLYGGSNGSPHVIATGAASDDVVPVVRGAWPVHEVTRMDTAQDFDEEGGYDRLRAVMLELAEASRITVTSVESTRQGVRSRTTYLGAPSSRVRVRLYEKGKFEQQQGHGASEHWFRLESQIRPTGQRARLLSASIGPVEAWGMARWTRDLAAAAMGVDVQPITMQLRREPDYMRAIRNLARQYGPTLQKAIEVEGSWESVLDLLVSEGMGMAHDAA